MASEVSSPESSPLKRQAPFDLSSDESPTKKPRTDPNVADVGRRRLSHGSGLSSAEGSPVKSSPLKRLTIHDSSDEEPDEKMVRPRARRVLNFGDQMLLDLPPKSHVDTLIEQAKAVSQALRLSGGAEDQVITYAKAIQRCLPEAKGINLDGCMRIAAVIVDFFEMSPDAPRTYLPISYEGLPRAVIVCPQQGNFYVLSGKEGKLRHEGAERFVGNATRIHLDEGEVHHKIFACIENLTPSDAKSLKKQAALSEDIYQDVEFILEQEDNVFVIEELYGEKNLEQLEKHLTTDQIASVLRKIFPTLSFLQRNNLYHGDINLANIVVKDAFEKIKLTDFGRCHGIDSDEWPKELLEGERGYGTYMHSAPEHFGAALTCIDAFQQSAADDMFALGCVLYRLLFPKQRGILPWRKEVEAAIKSKKVSPELNAKATLAYTQGIAELQRRQEGEADPKRKALIEICYKLLEMNPTQRITLEALGEKLDSLPSATRQ